MLSRRAAFVNPEDSDVFSSPRKITKNLAASRIENATLRDRANSHELEVQRRDRIIGQLEARATELEGKLEEATKELKGSEEKRRGESSAANLLRQEVAMLKRHLVRLPLPHPSSTSVDPSLARRKATRPKKLSNPAPTSTRRRTPVSTSWKSFSTSTSGRSRA
jgi:predicted ribosome quality control (RQC) complex YloA/Tae2 family protein